MTATLPCRAGSAPREILPVGRDDAMIVLGPEHYPLKETFAPGIYMREIFLPAGHFIVGEKHRTRHLNTLLTGRVLAMLDGVLELFEAPCTFESEAGVSKRLFILQDCRWQTYHANPDDEPDSKVIRERVIEETPIAAETLGEFREMRALIETLIARERKQIP